MTCPWWILSLLPFMKHIKNYFTVKSQSCNTNISLSQNLLVLHSGCCCFTRHFILILNSCQYAGTCNTLEHMLYSEHINRVGAYNSPKLCTCFSTPSMDP